MHKEHLLGMTIGELKEVASSCSLPAYTAKQIAEWIYKKKISSIQEMTNISLKNREILSEKYNIGRQDPVQSETSSDGTVKYLFNVDNERYIETVMIPEDERATLCVSSQTGCKFNCLFCMTGKQGFGGNLSSNKILNQIFSVKESDKLTNIVFMGMGEPLDNYEQLKKVLEIITSDYGLGWSPKRITVSTTGILPKLKLFLEDSNVHLAVSLHSPFKEERYSLMPIEKAYSFFEILSLLKEYDWSKQRRLSFEYIMFKGVNDSINHAKELAKLLNRLDCRVNLIRYHAIPDIDLKTSDIKAMEQFRDYLIQKGITSTIRTSRGEDISAACGMLSTQKNTSQ